MGAIMLEPTDEELLELEQIGFAPTMQEAIEDHLSLDELWTDAQAQVKKARRTPSERVLEAEQAKHRVYTNPDNWIKVRGIALVHQETQTLLGNFTEYVHRSVRECRKLLRESDTLEVAAVEFVTGKWWLADTRKPEPVQVWHTTRSCRVHVYLPDLGVHAPATLLTIFLSHGSIARAELAEDTRLAQWLSQNEQLLDLPAGTDVYEFLAPACKIKIKEELGL